MSTTLNDVMRAVTRIPWVHSSLMAIRLTLTAVRDPGAGGHRFEAFRRVVRFVWQTSGGRLVEVPVGERSLLLAGIHETNSRRAIVSRLPDTEPMKVWLRRLRPGDLFVDVGANIGMYSVIVGETGADVVACEPVASSADRLLENVALNGRRVELVRAALADRPGKMRITTSLDSYNHLAGDAEGGPVAEVPVRTLDEVLDGRRAAGVKVDVQGAERLVLEGARRALSEKRIELLQLEWNSWSRSLLGEPRARTAELLRSHGYELYRADADGNLHPTHGDESEGHQDIFAMPVRPRGDSPTTSDGHATSLE